MNSLIAMIAASVIVVGSATSADACERVGSVVTHPVWLHLPTYQDMCGDFYPRCKPAQPEAFAKMDCVLLASGALKDCHTIAETPNSYGGKMELSVAHAFRLDMLASCAQAGDHIVIPMHFVKPPG